MPTIQTASVYKLVMRDAEHPTPEDAEPIFTAINSLPVSWVEPVDISKSVLFLAYGEARYITGPDLTVDAGHTAK